ncbi:unnamed protein product [Mytilus coruscus]|uniref:Uncharacterized protein n=1 Tax=Mytilus coruscus TaxID=42192 RepID=A0A6J8BN34_MYTCO|nr:unnamed protein product [Mytilus coruscus]
MPIERLEFSSENRSIRKIEPSNCREIITKMKISFLNGDAVRLPDAIGMVPQSVMSEDIENGKVNVETINGNHTMLALRELNEEFPSEKCFLSQEKRKLFKPKQKSAKGKAGGVKSKGKTNIKRKADGRQTSSKGKGKAGKPTTSVPDPPGPSPMENEENVSNNDEMDNVLHISNYNYFILSCLSRNEFISYS